MSDLWADDAGYDDDDVYKDDCPRLEMLPAPVPINIDLYTNPNDAATRAQGGTKSHYTPILGGTALFDTGDKSDYQISVERLAWVDGWQESTIVNGKLVQKQPMTLVVLKFIFQSFERDLRVGSVKATLQFKDVNNLRGDDPEVQAWAPFRNLEDWNASKAQNKTTTNTNASAGGGYAGSPLSLRWSEGREIAWNRTHFDEGRSILVKSKLKQRPIGVTWYMKQNQLENLGIAPVVWAAVLVKRKTPDSSYLVKFRMDVRTGTRHDLESKVKGFLRIKPGDTSSFMATPRPGVWDKINCFGEGEDIRDSKNVDLDNLGKLLDADRTALSGTWGPQYQRSAPSVKEEEEEGKATPEPGPTAAQIITAVKPAGAETLPPATSDPGHDATQQPIPAAAAADPAVKNSNEPPPREPSYLPRVMVGASSIEADAIGSISRLGALEARAAQTEARLAAQDLQILQLQRTLDARDALLARMEQALPGAATRLSQF